MDGALSQSEHEDLQPGGANVVNPAKNRRATIRYQCAPATSGKVYAPNDIEFQIAWILNLSKTGAGILMNKELPVGLRILLSIRSLEYERSFELYAQVVRSFRQATGDYLLGCKFVNPLSDDDLDALL